MRGNKSLGLSTDGFRGKLIRRLRLHAPKPKRRASDSNSDASSTESEIETDENFDHFSVSNLKKTCRERGLSPEGPRSELLLRLQPKLAAAKAKKRAAAKSERRRRVKSIKLVVNKPWLLYKPILGKKRKSQAKRNVSW